MITIMSSLAQEESRSISENTTWGKRKQFADGKGSVAFTYKGKYEAKIEQLSEEVSHLEKGLKALDKQMEQHRALKRDSDNLRENRELTAALIDRLIDRVEVSKDKQITVRYRFESKFDSCEEVLNQCKNM